MHERISTEKQYEPGAAASRKIQRENLNNRKGIIMGVVLELIGLVFRCILFVLKCLLGGIKYAVFGEDGKVNWLVVVGLVIFVLIII